jgi:hypothetical protein
MKLERKLEVWCDRELGAWFDRSVESSAWR